MRVRRMMISEGKAVNISQYPNFSATGSIKRDKRKVLREKCPSCSLW